MIARMQTNGQWLIAAAVALVLGVFLLFWVRDLLNSPRYAGVTQIDELISLRTEDIAPEITKGVEVSQTFVATDNDLTEVKVFLGTYMRQNTASLEFTLSDGGATTRSVRAAPETIIDNRFHAFTFAPVHDSHGKTYTVTLTSPGGKPGNAFTAWLSNCNCYPDGVLMINGAAKADQELVMRAEFAHPNVVVWKELINRMSQYKPGIVQGAGLVLLGMIGMGLALVAVAGVTLSVMPRSEDEPLRRAWLLASIVAAVIVVLATGSLSRF